MHFKEEIINDSAKNLADISSQSLNEDGIGQEDAIETEISPEIKDKAKESLLKSIKPELSIDSPLNKENLELELSKAIQDLPRYRELEEKMKDKFSEDIIYDVFKLIRQSSDSENINNTKVPEDGVLVNSMKTGLLKCAGRVMIASEFLKKNNIRHSIGQAPNHSIIIGELDENKLAYFDGQSNLYFTFPKQALRGYTSADETRECILNDYIPEKSDKTDGLNGVWRHMVVMPSGEGVLRQYFGNMCAALNGNEEFKNSGIKKDSQQAEALNNISQDVLGDNPVYNKFKNETPSLAKESIRNFSVQEQILKKLFSESSDKDDFTKRFIEYKSDIVKIFPFLNKNSDEIIKESAAVAWNALNNSIEKEIPIWGALASSKHFFQTESN